MNKKFLLSLFLLVALSINSANAVIGVDVSDPIDEDTFNCLIDNYGIEFVISRGYESIGQVDYDAIDTNLNARSAGLITDVYLFPCLAIDPSQIASDFVSSMVDGNGNDVYGTVWIDIEYNPSSTCGWSSDINQNCNFLNNLVSSLQSYGKLVGIYSSQYQWSSIFADQDNCPYFTSLPVWYAHYDGSASFDDWYNGYSFGGWSDPSIKQYDGNETGCGAGVDFNFY
ncbi:hypothetical protein ABPG72_014920 [Tetrahymena utriculariae]